MTDFKLKDFKISATYTFDTNAPAILGTTITNAKLLAIMDYETALKYDNVDLKYRTIYPLLVSAIDSPKSCIYYRFNSESGESIILADQWINESTVTVIKHITMNIVLNKTVTSDQLIISNMLKAMGYSNFVITTKEV